MQTEIVFPLVPHPTSNPCSWLLPSITILRVFLTFMARCLLAQLVKRAIAQRGNGQHCSILATPVLAWRMAVLLLQWILLLLSTMNWCNCITLPGATITTGNTITLPAGLLTQLHLILPRLVYTPLLRDQIVNPYTVDASKLLALVNPSDELVYTLCSPPC